jgi:penicillin-insensitive murein endopeptidase
MWSSQGRLARALAVALALVAVSGLAVGAPKGKAAAHAKKGDKSKKGSRSIGAPNHGKLEGAALLKQSKNLKQKSGGHSWGLPQMVGLLHRAANGVSKKHKGSVMFVGDLSGKTGGKIDRHGSHQSGRDADVGFYVVNSKGNAMPVKRFIAFDDQGNARDVPGARFDEARNWALVEAFLKDKEANVRYLFVTNGLKARLLAHAAKKHAPKDLVDRAAAAMMSPPDADLHDDHFHVRIACPESMKDACIEESTVRSEPRGGDGHAKADSGDSAVAP